MHVIPYIWCILPQFYPKYSLNLLLIKVLALCVPKYQAMICLAGSNGHNGHGRALHVAA